MRNWPGHVEGAQMSDTTETSQDNAVTQAGPVVLAVPASSFDLLEGAAESRDKTRVFNYVLVIVAVLALTLLGSRGMLMWLEAGNADTATQDYQNQAAVIRAELDARRAAGEVSGPAVEAFLEQRRIMVAEVVGNEVDYARIILEANTMVNSLGGRLNTVIFTAPGQEAPPPDPTGTATTLPNSGMISDAVNSGDQTAGGGGSGIQITGGANGPDVANAIVNRFLNRTDFPYFEPGIPGQVSCVRQPADGELPCTWTWNGTLNDESRVDRTDQITSALELGS